VTNNNCNDNENDGNDNENECHNYSSFSCMVHIVRCFLSCLIYNTIIHTNSTENEHGRDYHENKYPN
jgi:hypothetical protein